VRRAKLAFIFPGQGSQYVGMGRAMAERFPQVAAAFAEADAALGEPISRLCFYGPEEALRRTENTQPAILATSTAIYRLVAETVRPDCVAGHSVGEYAAFVAAGVLSLADAVGLVRLRGRLMEQAVPAGTGAMAAILGLSTAAVADICRQAARHGVVEPATLNGAGQTVIAGLNAAVAEAVRLAQAAGAKGVRMLNVSGPFHTSLLVPAGEQLREALASVTVNRAVVPVYPNTLAQPEQEPDRLAAALIEQVSTAVRWEETVVNMHRAGVRVFIELGPGRVLTGLVRRIVKDAEALHVEDPQSWDKFLAWAKGNGVI
jgi:[acyl-carrier-protein] S-malonyltransferase